MRRQPDQIVAVRAIAVAEHDQMRGLAVRRRQDADRRAQAQCQRRYLRSKVPAMIVTRFAPSPTGLLHLGHAFAAIDRLRSRGTLSAAHRGSSTPGAASRNTKRRSSKISPGWAFASERAGAAPIAADRGVSRCAGEAGGARLALSLLLHAQGDRRGNRARRRGAAPRGSRWAALSRHLPRICRPKRAPPYRAGRVLRACGWMRRKRRAKTGPLFFEEQARGRTANGRIAVEPLLFGDVVLARKEMPAAYHLAVVVDDAFQGVTLVTRGDDLLRRGACAAAAAGAAGLSRARLCPSPPHPGQERPQILQARSVRDLARLARGGRHAGRGSGAVLKERPVRRAAMTIKTITAPANPSGAFTTVNAAMTS